MFFMLAGLVIIQNNNLSMINDSNIVSFTGLYLKWIDGLYSNFQSLTGQMIKLDWIPNNQYLLSILK